jgi:hypothetical protein
MNPREILSTILLCMGFILALLPFSADRSFSVKPQKLLSEVLDEKSNFSVDQVARFIVSEDSTVQIIDLRSINIPYSELISRDPESILDNPEIKNIFYSNGDLNSGYALVFTRGLDYKNIYVMKGGLNEWFNTIMNSSFTGERISARENALFETRTRAEKLFTEMNSLPDSLKIKYIESKHITARKLDGGCE